MDFQILVFMVFYPFFLRNSESAEVRPYGFYIGPVLGFGRNVLNSHYTTTLAVEPGYMFEGKKRFTIALGAQFGTSFFAYDSYSNKWLFHWGPKASFGFWVD